MKINICPWQELLNKIVLNRECTQHNINININISDAIATHENGDPRISKNHMLFYSFEHRFFNIWI